MAHFTSALSFLLVLVLLSLVQIEARESKFFTKAVIHADPTTKNVTHHVEPPSPSPSLSPSPAPVEAEISSGYCLYGREIPKTSGITGESLFENNIPTKEFNEKFNNREFENSGLPSNYNEHSYVTVPQGDNREKFDNNGLPSNYNERAYVTVPQGGNKEKFENEEFHNNGLPSNYNEHSYVTVPQGTNLYDTKFNEFSNNEEKLTPEEEELFNENRNHHNEHNQNAYNNYNVNEPQGMSDTRTLENGKYRYTLDGQGRQRGWNPPKYKSEGYYGNNGERKSRYEFDTMEEFERQEGYSEIPGEYINP